jgi:serine phosphatase RsbU (regulator of sigma subunit)/catechol 2,3-dioxygenase-like lactoylglutathione lyase family enzyme
MASSQSFDADERAGLRRDRSNPYLRVHAVNVYVRDQDRSLEFYRDQLGFSLAFDVLLQSGQRWVGVSPPDGTAVLTLIAPSPESDEYKFIGRPSDVVFVTEDVIATYTEWRRRGVSFRHTPRLRRVRSQQPMADAASPSASMLIGKQTPVWGGVFTRFEDLDRNSFALVSFDEMSQAVEEQRRAASEKLESERRAAHELMIAKQVQARLFPQTLPVLKTLEYAGVCIQARQVGGDYYDFLNLGRERFGLVLGDIAGKGIAGALLMANLQANLRSQCTVAWDEPQRLLQSVNELFYANTADSAYATLFFGEYDDRSRRLRYANCGHLCGLLLRGNDSLVRLDSTCMVLGLFKEWECSIAECHLLPGDTLLLYTDGVTECFNAAAEEFGETRLIEVLRRNCQSSSADLLNAIVDDVQRFSVAEQYDDLTLIVAKCVGD